MRILLFSLLLFVSPVNGATIGQIVEDCTGLKEAISSDITSDEDSSKIAANYMFCYGYLLGIYDQRKALCGSLQVDEYREGFEEGKGLDLIAGFNGSSYAEFDRDAFINNFLVWFGKNKDKADEQIVAYAWGIFPKCELN